MDIDRFFSLGPAAPFEVHDVFTDRETALSVFRHRASAHASRLWAASELMDFQRPAENLLTFVGIGGVGKSTLLRQAVGLASSGHLAGVPAHGASVLLNFADPDVLSFESVVPAENLIRAGQAACRYSWRTPPRRSCRGMSK